MRALFILRLITAVMVWQEREGMAQACLRPPVLHAEMLNSSHIVTSVESTFISVSPSAALA